jgi:RNA polymerase sigma-70 factor (ECF subfamily)
MPIPFIRWPVIFRSVNHLAQDIAYEQRDNMQESNPRAVRHAALSGTNGLLHEGRSGTFEHVYKTNSELIRRICLRMLRDPIEAEDATQDVFVRVLLKLHTFRGESALSSWLYRLTTNHVLMRFRKNNHKHAALCASLDDDGALHRDIGKPDLHLTGVADRIDLEKAIDRLPDGHRAVFVLHDIQGYAHREIAEHLGYSIGNSKSQLHKARRRLRKLLIDRPVKRPLQEAKLKLAN